MARCPGAVLFDANNACQPVGHHVPHRHAGDGAAPRLLQPDHHERIGRQRRQAPCRRGHAGRGLHLRVRRRTMAKTPIRQARRAARAHSPRAHQVERRRGCSSRCLALEGLRDPRAHRRQGHRVRRGRERDDALGPHRRRQRRPRVVHSVLAAQRHRGGGQRPTFAWHKPGRRRSSRGTDKPLTIGPDTPWQTLPGQRQITAFLCGNNETHTRQPDVGRRPQRQQHLLGRERAAVERRRR